MNSNTAKSKYGKAARFFWWCSGADKELMNYCKFNDHVKYGCLGGIVFATGLMAALSGGFAFYTIFQERGAANSPNIFDLGLTIASFIFGFLWGYMIFNLDRYIVASTGKGDGTDNITWKEFKNALPRLFMGMILAITISKPLEIRIFKSEIDAELEKIQENELSLRFAQIDSTSSGLITDYREKVEAIQNEIHTKEIRFNQLEDIYTEEVTGKRGGRGKGPEAEAIEVQMKSLKSEIETLKQKYEPELAELNQKIGEEENNKSAKRETAKSQVNALDGLLERIKISHELSPSISLFITLLFLAIELTPIFFKLMIIKSAYDYLEENKKELILAEHGIKNISTVQTIIKKGNQFVNDDEREKSPDGKIIQTTVYLNARKLSNEMRHKILKEIELNNLIIDKLAEETKKDINTNPDNYKA